MRRTPLFLVVALGAAGCARPTPRASSTAAEASVPPTPTVDAARDPTISGVVGRQITGRGAERYEIVASAAEPRSDFVGIVKVERRDAPPFAARLRLKDVFHDAVPWTVRAEISRFDGDVALPLLTIGESVEIVPMVRIPWLDDRPAQRGASDVAPGSR